jgi:putative tryptophan/tyrosine transport system substrate-binding protein
MHICCRLRGYGRAFREPCSRRPQEPFLKSFCSMRVRPRRRRHVRSWYGDTLSAEGLVEGKSFVLSMSVASDNGQLPKLAKDLVRLGVRAILAVGPLALRAARTVTATIPIVALDLETDPVKAGFAESLSHPGGNVTGLFFDFPEFSGKLLGLLQEARPGLSRVAALWDPTSGPVQIEAAVAAATARGLQLQTLKVDDLGKLPEAFVAADA